MEKKELFETKIDEVTGEKMYKSKCCGTWEYDITKEGLCQPCFEEQGYQKSWITDIYTNDKATQ